MLFKIDWPNGLAIAGLIITLVLVALDKAGKLKGSMLLILLGIAALLTLPFALNFAWFGELQGLAKFTRGLSAFFLVALVYSLVAVWVTAPETSSAVSKVEAKPEAKPEAKHLLLTPGHHPTPAGPPCTGDSITPLEVLKGEIAVFLGDSIAVTKGTGTAIVNIDGENVLAFKRATSEVYLDAILRDSPGHEVGRITGNVVTLNSTNYEAVNPDAHNIAILDSKGQRVLSVRYVNESVMVVSGIFYGSRSGPFWVTDGEPIALPDIGTVFGGSCFQDYDGPLFRLGHQIRRR